jgi:hypothetical protein
MQQQQKDRKYLQQQQEAGMMELGGRVGISSVDATVTNVAIKGLWMMWHHLQS